MLLFLTERCYTAHFQIGEIEMKRETFEIGKEILITEKTKNHIPFDTFSVIDDMTTLHIYIRGFGWVSKDKLRIVPGPEGRVVCVPRVKLFA